MTILEALGHIQGVEGCDKVEALEQLCAALTDHPAIYSLTDEPPAPRFTDGLSWAPQGPDPVWQPDKVNVAESRVWCDYGPHPITKKRGRNRSVLISQDAVRIFWKKLGKRGAGRKPTIITVAMNAIREKYPHGVPDSVTDLVLHGEVFEITGQRISERTVIRARKKIDKEQSRRNSN